MLRSLRNKFNYFFSSLAVKNIRCVIWDIDGTLYTNNVGIGKEMIAITIAYIANNTNIQKDIIIRHVLSQYKLGRMLGEITENEYGLNKHALAVLAEQSIDRTKYLTINSKLVDTIQRLNENHIENIILTNSSEENAVQVLKKLGFKKYSFSKILGMETLKESNKPSQHAFSTVHSLNNYNKRQYLMVGDSLTLDIKPAKAYGFLTCHINQNPDKYQDKSADFMVNDPTLVYSLIYNS